MSKHISTVSIANELGVSQSAVSYVLNNRWREKRISPQTRDRILTYARSIEYRPNRLALGLQERRTYTVGIIVSFITGSFYQDILSGVESVLGKRFVLLLGVSENDAQKEARLIKQFLEYRVDGLLIAWSGARSNHGLLKEIVTKQIPFVMIDRYNPQLKTHYVGADNKSSGRMITEHLIDRGLQEIYFIPPKQIQTSSAERLEGYQEAMLGRGLNPKTVNVTDFQPSPLGAVGEDNQIGYLALKQIGSSAKPLGVVASNAPIAYGALRAAKELGLRIPGELQIGTIGQEANVDLFDMSVSCMTLETEAMGREAATILHQQIDHPDYQKEAIRRSIPGKFMQGKSTLPRTQSWADNNLVTKEH